MARRDLINRLRLGVPSYKSVKGEVWSHTNPICLSEITSWCVSQTRIFTETYSLSTHFTPSMQTTWPVRTAYAAVSLQVDCLWNVMAHAQKPDFVFPRNGRVHLNRRGRQFSRLLTAEVCASAVVMLDTSCSEVVWSVLATHSIRQFPFTSPPVCHRVSSHFNWSLPLALQVPELQM
jgi:hypothetical protein